MFALRQGDTGVTVAEVCRRMGISEATYYNWKKRYGGLGVPELRRLKHSEEENQHLKQLAADLNLNKQMLQDVFKKILRHGPLATRPNTSLTLIAFRPAGLVESLVCSAPAGLIKHVVAMIPASASACATWRKCQVHYGSQRLCSLLRREGWLNNYKRVHRLYYLEGLSLCSKRPRRNPAAAHRLKRLPLGHLP